MRSLDFRLKDGEFFTFQKIGVKFMDNQEEEYPQY